MKGSRPAKEKDLGPRVRRTRTMLQDALASLLTRKDFGEISIGDIAEESADQNQMLIQASTMDRELSIWKKSLMHL